MQSPISNERRLKSLRAAGCWVGASRRWGPRLLSGFVRELASLQPIPEDRLGRLNSERIRALAARTSALLTAWKLQRSEIVSALGEIEDGRRILTSYLSSKLGEVGEVVAAGFDVSR